MRTLRLFLGLAFLTITFGLTTTGCRSLLGSLLGDPAIPPVLCVVEYVQIAPGVYLGQDRCENYWLRWQVSADSTACEIISEDGQSMIPIACPAEGDTLGD